MDCNDKRKHNKKAQGNDYVSEKQEWRAVSVVSEKERAARMIRVNPRTPVDFAPIQLDSSTLRPTDR